MRMGAIHDSPGVILVVVAIGWCPELRCGRSLRDPSDATCDELVSYLAALGLGQDGFGVYHDLLFIA